MKTILIAATIAAVAAIYAVEPAMAGSLSDPVVTPQVVMADTVDHSTGNVEGILAAVAVIAILLGAAGAF